MLIYYFLFTKRQLSVRQSACMCLFFGVSAAPSFAQLVQVNSDLEEACFIQKWCLPLCLFFLPLTGPSFSNQNIPCVLLIHTAVKSADMSGGRPEVTLPQDPTPVLGLWMPGFPLCAPPWFLALEMGWGALWEALHTVPQTEEVILKSCPTLPQEICPSSGSCCYIEKSGTLEVKGYWVLVGLSRPPSSLEIAISFSFLS